MHQDQARSAQLTRCACTLPQATVEEVMFVPIWPAATRMPTLLAGDDGEGSRDAKPNVIDQHH